MKKINLRRKFVHAFNNASPARAIILSFVLIISIGTLLLMMPFSSNQEPTGLVDSLFVATSATCVTGLSPVDTWSHWSVFGQLIILLLIQIGGIGLVTFTTGFTLLVRGKIGLRDIQIAREHTNSSVKDVVSLIKMILVWTFCCESIGVLFFMIKFVPQYGLFGVWLSVFTSVSAYCNSGFDIFGFISQNEEILSYATDPIISLTISLLVELGGIGFLVVNDIHRVLEEKFKKTDSHQRLTVHSMVVLRTTGILLVSGVILFLVFEYNNVLAGKNLFESFNIALVQSASSRTAGFCVIPLKLLNDLSKVIVIILMFIGASPSSTGGGVKTTTIVILLSTVVSVLRGRGETVIMKHRINQKTVYKALTIVVLSVLCIVTSSMLVNFIESGKNIAIVDIAFEMTAAFSTVGQTVGVTAILSGLSKVIVAITMFIGRMGITSLVLALTVTHQKKMSSILPEGKVVV